MPAKLRTRPARTRLMEVLAIFDRSRRPLSATDLSQMLNVPDTTARQYLCRLRSHECVRFVYGSFRTGRYFERVPGAAPPSDSRPFTSPENARRAASRPPAPDLGLLDHARRALKKAL